MSDAPEIMTLAEVADYLRIHRITAGRYAAGGRIPGRRLGRRWVFSRSAIESWIERSPEREREGE